MHSHANNSNLREKKLANRNLIVNQLLPALKCTCCCSLFLPSERTYSILCKKLFSKKLNMHTIQGHLKFRQIHYTLDPIY